MKLRALGVLIIAACGSSTSSEVGAGAGSGSGSVAVKPADAAGPATRGPSIRAALAKAAAGKPLLLALDDSGQLIARSIDGSFKQTLAPGPYGAAFADDARELVWLRGDLSFDVIDLRAHAPARAKQLIAIDPPKAMEKFGDDIIEPPIWSMTDFVQISLATQCSTSSGLRFEWSSGGVGALRGAERMKVVAKDWFAAEEHRAPRTGLPAAFTDQPGHVKLRDTSKCKGESKDECGQALAFGATGKALVEVAIDVEHCPAKHCALRDPKTKALVPVPGADTAENAETCGPYLFDPTGTSYLIDDNVCGPDGACASVGKQAIGWLDSSRAVEIR